MSEYFPPSHKSLEKHSLKFVSWKNNRLKKNMPQLPGMLAFHFPIHRLKRKSPSLFPPLIPCSHQALSRPTSFPRVMINEVLLLLVQSLGTEPSERTGEEEKPNGI